MSAIDIIKSKLTRPAPVEAIHRTRLVHLMNRIPDNRITVVSAGAGYGKSTLIAQACQHLGLRSLWYKLEKSDGDFTTFLHYLIAGFQRWSPDFGASTIESINNNYQMHTCALPISPRVQPAILSRLATEMENGVTEETLVVLDDYHEVASSEEIRNAVLFLVANAPPNIHLILISRTDSDIPLSRYRAERKVLDIGKSDLVFSASEIQQLFSTVFRMKVSHAWFKDLYQKTEGWITGLILFYHYAKGKTIDEIDALLEETGGNNQIIADYMQENLWAGQTETVQRFLMETAIFSVIDVDMADTVLEREDSGNLLKTLERRHLFTCAVDETGRSYCYHQLFQNFLQNKLISEMGKNHFRALHQKTARHYEQMHNREKALEHFLAAEDYDNFFRLLETTGQALLRKGRFRHLDSLLENIPAPLHQTEPWVLYYKANIFFAAGHFQEVIHLARQAHEAFVARNHMAGARLCLMDMGQAYYWLGDFSRAEKIFKELLQCLPLSPKVTVKTLGHLVLTSAWCGNMAASDRYFDQLTETLAAQPPTDEFRVLKAWTLVCQGFRFQFAGDFIRSVEKGKQALEAIGELETGQSLAFCYQLLGISWFFLGDFKKSSDMNRKGLRLVHEKGFSIYEAWYLNCLALIDLHSDRHKAARKKATRAFGIFDTFGSKWGKAFSVLALLPIYMKIGSKHDIEDITQTALTIAENTQSPWFEGKFHYYNAIGHMLRGDLEQAHTALDRAKAISFFNAHDLVLIDFVQANVYLQQGAGNKAVNLFLAALENFRKNGYGLWVIRYHSQWLMPLLVAAYDTGEMRPYLEKIFAAIGEHAPPLLKGITINTNPPAQTAAADILTRVFGTDLNDLKVYCFGRFQVFVGDREIPEAAWKSRKARRLFQYLILYRKKGVIPKETLMAVLWPAEKPGKTLNRFRVAVTTLRKTLEPDLKKWHKSTFLERRHGGYAITIGDNGYVDTEAFESKIQTAHALDDKSAEINQLIEALAIYRGELFEETGSEEWAVPERNRFSALYLEAAKTVADLYADIGKYDKSIEYAWVYLEKDPAAEEMYQRLMNWYTKTDNKAMAAKTYKVCEREIAERFSCALSRKTVSLYQKLLKTN
ncbi:MAG: BTAD domain-containing putative transcriptional regulator [Thermodesulfobacteriota bacterium]|nr:BTAD domain-containing putative transcriptional regulator [Thermodesulfobacteriota bacterium]